MPLPSYHVMSLSKWVQYWLLEGEHVEDLAAHFARRFPDIATSVYQTALRYARRALAIGQRVAGLGPGQTLREALGRGQPPDDNVSVRFLFHWSDNTGREYWNTIRVSATWNDQYGDVQDRARQLLDQIAGRYGGVAELSVEVIPAVLFPSGEQL